MLCLYFEVLLIMNCVLFEIITLTMTTKGFSSIVSSTNHHECFFFFFLLKKKAEENFFIFIEERKKYWNGLVYVLFTNERTGGDLWPNKITTEPNLYLFIEKRETNAKDTINFIILFL